MNLRRFDEHVEDLLAKWGAVPEEMLGMQEIGKIKSYYFRYRNQIFDKDDAIKKMEWNDFWIEMEMRERAADEAESEREIVKISEREKARQRRVNQLSLFK